MDEKKYQIFVSSTYKDLIDAREAVVKTILSLYHVPIGMEMFSADDAEQWEIISETIKVSDYYVVIIGHRYGSETSEGISFTEKEYDYARQKGIPVLAFIRKRTVATKPEERDDVPDKVKKLDAFIAKASNDKMCDYWESTEELAKEVAIALPKTFRRNPRVGWIRADKAASPEIMEELAKLSRENRVLRKDYEQLKVATTDNKPSLNVLLNGEKQLNLIYKPVNFNKYLAGYPEKIEYSQIPSHLQPYISREEVDKYNSSLPSNEIIDIYNTKVERHFRFKETGRELSITVGNGGTAKANEIFIEIELPEQLLVLGKDDISLDSMPKSPIPDSPIPKAEKKYQREYRRQNREYRRINMVDHFSAFANMQRPIKSIPPSILSTIMRRVLPGHSSRVDNNIITIKIDGLLHTRQEDFDDFIISPLADGDYVVKASIICAEYKAPEIVEIPIKVSKE